MTEELEKYDSQIPMTPVEDSEDPSLAAVVALPDYATCDEQKVVNVVKTIFKGFTPDPGGEALKFDTTDALAVYTQQTMDDIQRINKTAEANQLYNKAAVMARFWYLGSTINNALQTGDYGSNAVQRLSTALNKSVPYIYQVRAVATNLTVVDCYLLGMRGLASTHLRKLAQIKDENIRKGIIDGFIAMFSDTSDPKKMEAARKQAIAAINSAQNAGALNVATSDPLNGGTEVEVSPEYNDTIKTLKQLQKVFTKLADPHEVRDKYISVLENFYLTKETPDAETHLNEAKELAGNVKVLMEAAVENMRDIVAELNSIGACGLV